jgi:hypothetical protein
MQPRGEALRKAVRFISVKREEDPSGPVATWVEEATVRFDLDPVQGEWLHRFAREAPKTGGPSGEEGDR